MLVAKLAAEWTGPLPVFNVVVDDPAPGLSGVDGGVFDGGISWRVAQGVEVLVWSSGQMIWMVVDYRG